MRCNLYPPPEACRITRRRACAIVLASLITTSGTGLAATPGTETVHQRPPVLNDTSGAKHAPAPDAQGRAAGRERGRDNGSDKATGNGNGNGNGLRNGSLDAERQSRKRLEDPLTGIVINRTITVLGKDFYHYFVTAWRELDGKNTYTITVFERPSARFGSEVWVEYRRIRMFHLFMSPARQAARETGETAARTVYESITENEVQRALFKSPDLAEEEL